jgi:hypothetical protein
VARLVAVDDAFAATWICAAGSEKELCGSELRKGRSGEMKEAEQGSQGVTKHGVKSADGRGRS